MGGSNKKLIVMKKAMKMEFVKCMCSRNCAGTGYTRLVNSTENKNNSVCAS